MKARPILFNADMVRALLDGRKTQTRRVLKPPFEMHANGAITKPKKNPWGGIERLCNYECPFGQVGDLLYVRERFMLFDGCGCSDHCLCPPSGSPIYFATQDDGESKWTPSIHMPRWASRLTLKITDVRVGRVQDINEDDSQDEGVFHTDYGLDKYRALRNGWSFKSTSSHTQCLGSARFAFANLWISTGGDWHSNPWVWVVEFEVIHKNIDEVLV